MKIKSTYLENPQAVTASVEAQMSRHHIPGATVALLHQGEVVYTHAFGTRTPAAAPMTEYTLFEGASLTKTLFGTLAMRLVQKGKLNLDEPIMNKLQDTPWSNDPRFATITPRHCLSHGCGLPNWQKKPMDMLFDPGTRYSYSGEGYFLLQRLIEQICGKDLNALLKEYFLEPLGMDISTATWTPEVHAAFSAGFGADGSVVKIRSARRVTGNAPEPNAAWSLYSNAFQMVKFQQYMVKHHGGLEDAFYKEMVQENNRPTHHVAWGLGWGLCDEEPNLRWHWGDNDGFKSLSAWDDATGDAICIFSNSDNGMEFWQDTAKEVMGGEVWDHIVDFIRIAE